MVTGEDALWEEFSANEGVVSPVWREIARTRP